MEGVSLVGRLVVGVGFVEGGAVQTSFDVVAEMTAAGEMEGWIAVGVVEVEVAEPAEADSKRSHLVTERTPSHCAEAGAFVGDLIGSYCGTRQG